ncbi:toxin-activating lysine-acyltransferase [Pseudomonas sp. Z5-35]|uniref:toxin-activating lysine-acyltransferase n=1 Tax=unclassified Pseudomonas TaxID=196821 RepID=UPI003DA8DBA3
MKKTYDLRIVSRQTEMLSKAQMLGYGCMVMLSCRRYLSFQLVNLKAWLEPAIDHDQIVFFFDRAGSTVGYVTWAFLAPDSELRLLNDPRFLLDVSEWNEGGNVWVIDFCFPSGGVLSAVSLLKSHFRNKGVAQVSWARQDARADMRKVSSYKVRG